MSPSAMTAGLEVRQGCAARAAAVQKEQQAVRSNEAAVPPSPLMPLKPLTPPVPAAEPGTQVTGTTTPVAECWILRALLVASLALNIVMVVYSFWPTVLAANGEVDTDGDGIPDRHDFCPRNFWSSAGSKFGWVSDQAKDFDGDGCEDGVEDQDRDNDGIWDAEDRCPTTPQYLGFVSNNDNDFDRDGCVDNLEDDDNDDDGLRNVADTCPSTRPGDISDRSGCSALQRGPGSREESKPPVRWWAKRVREAKCGQHGAEETWRQWLLALLGSHSFDVLLGAVLAWLLQQGYAGFSRLKFAPRSTGQVAKMAKTAGLMILRYTAFFAVFYTFERYRRSR